MNRPPPPPPPPSNPSFGIVNVESIMEGIQSCQMSLEESRLKLAPLERLLDADEDDDDHHHARSNGGGSGRGGMSGAGGIIKESYTDEHIVHEFLECTEHIFGAIDVLMVRLADGGLVPVHQHNNRDNGEGEESVYLLMASNCISKAADFVGRHCLTLLEADSLSGVGPLDDNNTDAQHGSSSFVEEGGGVPIQPCMARLVELALRVVHIRTTLEPQSSQSQNEQSNSHYNNGSSDEDDEDDEETILSPQTIIEGYSQYQRRCLRFRSKPSISSLAELRRVASSQSCFVSDLLEEEKRRAQMEMGMDDGDDDEHDDSGGGGGSGNNGMENGNAATARGQPHAQAITVILGEASSLIQPLAAWRDAIPPPTSSESNNTDDEDRFGSLLRQLCHDSIDILDNEASTLAVTVGSWFGPDQRGVATLDDHSSNATTQSDLTSIESSLEEMAFLCQVISRYCLFSNQIITTQSPQNNNGNSSSSPSELENLLTEQSLHYSTLETRLATLQFDQALQLASPQLVELGRPNLRVPSIVEDAHYVCVRAVERAAGTRSERAVWTVGHWVTEIWGVDHTGHGGGGGGFGGMMGGDDGVRGVYRALMQGVGCISTESDSHPEEGTSEKGPTSSKAENAFAAALLEATGDEPSSSGGNNKHHGGHGSAPPSGGLISFLARDRQQSLQSRIDAELCALNGISAASTACSALSGLFADLVEEKMQEEAESTNNAVNGDGAAAKSSSMLTFARDELASHSRSYKHLLQQRVRSLVSDLCGGDDLFDTDGKLCLQNLRLFIEKEVYNLDSSSFKQLEGEDRLESEMIGPIRNSQLFTEIGRDKCDAAVVAQMAEALGHKSAGILLQFLLRGNADFNEWGAMLLSKQVRLLLNVYYGLVLDSSSGPKAAASKPGESSSVGTASILKEFERVNQAVSILQLEKPSDWLAFAYEVGSQGEDNDGGAGSLRPEDIRKVMSLRVDFSDEAINNLKL